MVYNKFILTPRSKNNILTFDTLKTIYDEAFVPHTKRTESQLKIASNIPEDRSAPLMYWENVYTTDTSNGIFQKRQHENVCFTKIEDLQDGIDTLAPHLKTDRQHYASLVFNNTPPHYARLTRSTQWLFAIPLTPGVYRNLEIEMQEDGSYTASIHTRLQSSFKQVSQTLEDHTEKLFTFHECNTYP